jgi:hypothetical protein
MDKEKIDTIINSVFCLINAIFFIVDACLWPHDAIWVFVLAIIFSIVMDAFICAALFHPDWYIYMSSLHPYLFRNFFYKTDNQSAYDRRIFGGWRFFGYVFNIAFQSIGLIFFIIYLTTMAER